VPLSRRHHRIVWAASTLTALAAIGATLAWRIHKENAPEEYTPGEASRDITTSVSDRATNRTPLPEAARAEVASRAVDPMRDTGRSLPAGAPKPLFTDVTKDAGLGSFVQFLGPRSSQLPEDMGSGVAWGDFDNDGYDDLFVVSGGGALTLPDSQLAPSLLYRNLGNGRFEKVADFPELRIRGMAATTMAGST
jgi:hypothetical protein